MFSHVLSAGSVFQPSVRGIDFYAISAYVYALKAAHATRADTSLDLEILWDKVKDYCQQVSYGNIQVEREIRRGKDADKIKRRRGRRKIEVEEEVAKEEKEKKKEEKEE